MNKETIKNYLQKHRLNGWLIYDFQGLNPIAEKFLGIEGKKITRRCFIYIDKDGSVKILAHRIDEVVINKACADLLLLSPNFFMEGRRGYDNVQEPRLARVHEERRNSKQKNEYENVFNLDTYVSSNEMRRKLRKMLRGAKIIAMEYSPLGAIPQISFVDAGTFELIEKMGVKKIISSQDLIQMIYVQLDKDELKAHIRAAEKLEIIKNRSFALISEKLKENKKITEYDVQQFILDEFARMDLAGDEPMVAVNENSRLPHYYPNKKNNSVIDKNSLIMLDLWAKEEKKGIFADITWMAYSGKKIPAKYREIFNIVTGARDEALKFMGERVKQGKDIYGWEVDRIARNYIKNFGYEKKFIHSTGHNLHQEVHGPGVGLRSREIKDTRKILPRTAFTIEPGIYLDDFGIRSEIDGYIDDHGHLLITTPVQRKIVLL